MARTSLAARITIDPSFSDEYERNNSGEMGGHSLEEAKIRSPIDLTSRTPTHIRFTESELNLLAEYLAASGQNRNSELQSRQMVAIRNMEEQLRRLQCEISEMRRISPVGEILDRQSGGGADSRMDSSGPTAPLDLCSQQIVEASSNIESVDTEIAPSTVTVDRRVRLSKHCGIVQTSTEIAKKYSVSNKDKTFDNLDMMNKAFRTSNL